MDEPLRRTLDVLYDDWFRYENLCPRAMWLVELPFAERDRDPYLWPVRTFFLEHFNMTAKSVFDWRRFYLFQWNSSWHVGQDPPRGDHPRPQVFDIGVGTFTQNLESGGLSVDLTFGPLYGRGYELTLEGQRLSTWTS